MSPKVEGSNPSGYIIKNIGLGAKLNPLNSDLLPPKSARVTMRGLCHTSGLW